MSGSIIQVHEKQKGNPILKYVRIIKWQFTKDIVPDYVMGSTCAIFLSLKYHMKYPKYAERRILEVGKMFKLRILLLFVDDVEFSHALLDINKLCFVSDFTLILSWSNEECARYLETLKNYEDKPSNSIQEKSETEFLPMITKSLTSIKSVNKTDVNTLLDSFGSFQGICKANSRDLIICPGVGDKKAKRLYQAIHEPFLKKKSNSGFRAQEDSAILKE